MGKGGENYEKNTITWTILSTDYWPQDRLHRADDKWKAERLSCRFERTVEGYVPSTGKRPCRK